MEKKHALYPNLFSSIKVNHIVFPNRIFAAPITDEVFLPEMMRSGAALVVQGTVGINQPNAWGKGVYAFSKYGYQGMRRLYDYHKQGGAKVSAELIHTGCYGRLNEGEEYVYGPNDEINYEGTKVKAMDENEIKSFVESYAQAALDAKNFGYDMVMLHFAHGWLPAQFLSKAWNRRTDEYGGSYENRSKFPKMIVEAVRKAVGADYPVDMRISAKEWIDNEIEFADVLRFIKDVEAYLDMVNISAGTDMDKGGCAHMATSYLEGHMVNAVLAAEIKKHVKIPVAVVGAIMTPEEAEEILAEGKADIIMLGRALVADPDWIKKAYEGRPDEIRPCIRCGCCLHWTTNRYDDTCSVNPRLKRVEYVPEKIEKVDKVKNVIVVGGGPGGMSAALTAAQRGHSVTIIEKERKLGGALKLADYSGHKQDLKRYKDYLVGQVNRRNIKVYTETRAERGFVESLRPDVLILATGASPILPPIKGADKAVLAVDVYPEMDKVGKNVVIIGGGAIGCELAIELGELGRNVTIIELTSKLHDQENLLYSIALDQHMDAMDNIKAITDAKCTEIRENSVEIEKNSETFAVEADTVIVAAGMKSNSDIMEELEGITPFTYVIGDLHKVGKVKEANTEGYFAGYSC